MLHPNEVAIAYIWEKFVHTWVATSAIKIMQDVQQIQKGLAHKPFNKTSEQHQCFLRDLQRKIDVLEEEYNICF